VKSYGPQGWVVGGDLLEDSFYIATGILKILTFKNILYQQLIACLKEVMN